MAKAPGMDTDERRLALLASRALERGATCTEVQSMRWVAERLAVPLNRIGEDDPPSPAAVAILQWARSPGGMSEFMRAWTRLLPAADKIEAMDRFHDDGSELLEAIEEFRAFQDGGK